MKKELLVGIDEVGRGPIAGPVCVGVFIIDEKKNGLLKGIKDSKKLSPKAREEWFKKFQKMKKDGLIDFSCKMVGPAVIDKKGIVGAINLCVKGCCSRINSTASVFLDGGLKAPEIYKNQRTIIKGDEKIPVIAAASIVAKVMRDRKMVSLSKKYPKYGFEKHKGYGTREHYESIRNKGISKIHRKSFLSKLYMYITIALVTL